jgi:hypothetical protein
MPVMEVDASSIQMRLCYTNGVLDERSLGISAKAELVGVKNSKILLESTKIEYCGFYARVVL